VIFIHGFYRMRLDSKIKTLLEALQSMQQQEVAVVVITEDVVAGMEISSINTDMTSSVAASTMAMNKTTRL
jgi:hypothetical protein